MSTMMVDPILKIFIYINIIARTIYMINFYVLIVINKKFRISNEFISQNQQKAKRKELSLFFSKLLLTESTTRNRFGSFQVLNFSLHILSLALLSLSLYLFFFLELKLVWIDWTKIIIAWSFRGKVISVCWPATELTKSCYLRVW